MVRSDRCLSIESYQSLNARFAKSYVHQFGTGIGFCAEIVHLVKLMIICLDQKIQISLGEVVSPRGVAVCKGWEDYFLPLFPVVTGRFIQSLNRAHFPLGRLPIIKASVKMLLQKKYGSRNCFMFNPPTTLPNRLYVPEIGLDLDYWPAVANLAALVWRFNSQTQTHMDDVQKSLAIPSPYVALHIRRGDKIREAEYVPVSAYINAVSQIPSSEHLFVASDDSSAVHELRRNLPDHLKLYTLATPDRQGYSQVEFNRATSHERWTRTASFLGELETMARADIFIGGSPSNVYYFVRQLRGAINMFDVTRGKWELPLTRHK